MAVPALEAQRLRHTFGRPEAGCATRGPLPRRGPSARRRLVALASSGLAASLWATPAAAGTSTIAAPRIVYTSVNQTVDFSGTDAISSEPRTLSMGASISGSCNPTAGNGYSITLCGRVQLTLNDGTGGSLSLSQASTQVSTPQGTRYVTAWGAVAENPTDPAANGGTVFTIYMNGTLDQLNNTLAHLQYVPATDYEDRTYDEKTPPGPGTPNLGILVNDGSVSATNASATVVLRVEGTNGGPTVAAPAGPLAASAGVDNLYPATLPNPALLSVIDPELCLGSPNNRCDGAYSTGPLLPEPNDAMLLVMWIPEPSCGQFSLRSTSGFTNLGGATFPSVNAILTAANGLDLEQDAANAILATLGTAGAVNLSGQTSGLTTVFAGTAGSIADVRYALSQLTYKAPAGDATCHLNIAFSDLGNNGMPTSWIAPDPQGNPPVPEHEVPEALASTASVTFQVTDTHPDVSIAQIAPGAAGDPAGPNKPSGFRITFAEAIDPASFDASDLSLGTSTAAGAALGALAPVTPGLVYTVPVTALGDGTITLTMAADAACAAGHYSVACDAGYGSAAPTYADNAITWDQTTPKPTIGVKAGQANPTNGATVLFEVDAGETFSSAPASFDGADIDLIASTATTGSATVTWQGAGSPSKFTVSVPVSTSGNVVAKVKAGAYADTALNPNDASGTATVTVDVTPPTVTIEQAVGQSDPASVGPIHFTAVFSEPVTGFATGDVSVSGTAGATAALVTEIAPNDGTTYDVAVSNMAGSGTVIASVPPGVAVDGVQNANLASTSSDHTVTYSLAPQMSVEGNSSPISSGDATPSLADGTDFGTGDVGGSGVSHSFTIRNAGPASLNLTGNPRVSIGGASAGDFSVTSQPASPVAGGGGTTSFTVQFAASAAGTRSATISIANDDTAHDPYTFAIQGTGRLQYTVSGHVTNGIQPLAGVTLTFSHDGHTEVTAADGSYSYLVPEGTSGTVGPSDPRYSAWSPASRSISAIAADLPAQDFVATDDNDGVPASVESGPNGNDPSYDGNSDGVPDRLQPEVMSLPTATGSAYVTMAAPSGTSFESFQALPAPTPGTGPAGVSFPYGLFSFTLRGVPNGGSVALQLFLPPGAATTSYWKHGARPGFTAAWYEFQWDGSTGSQGGSPVTLRFTDGQRGDDDVTADGLIRDDGGPTTQAAQDATQIPTQSGTTLALLAVLMGLGGLWVMKRP